MIGIILPVVEVEVQRTVISAALAPHMDGSGCHEVSSVLPPRRLRLSGWQAAFAAGLLSAGWQ